MTYINLVFGGYIMYNAIETMRYEDATVAREDAFFDEYYKELEEAAEWQLWLIEKYGDLETAYEKLAELPYTDSRDNYSW